MFSVGMMAYLVAWVGAFLPSGRVNAPLTGRRLGALALFPLFFLLQSIHLLLLACDHVLFPGFRSVAIEKPVFILGVPRSGTTFLHRRLALDPSFTAPLSWEVFVAPSLCLRYAVHACAKVDNVLGQPLGRSLHWVIARFATDINDVHPVELTEAEEDYLYLLPTAYCFFAFLMFPGARWFRDLGRLDQLKEERRERVLLTYHRVLQRHMYFHNETQLLSKNAAFASWGKYLAQKYPDAAFVLCVREPDSALSSQLTSLATARTAFATFPDDHAIEAEFVELYEVWFAELVRLAGDAAVTSVIVEQQLLRRQPADVIAVVYECLGREVPPALLDDQAEESRAAGQQRRSWNIDPELLTTMRADYTRLLERSQRLEHRQL
ncbi:MAG: sulfotransferase [Pseudomonadota bacterium]